MNEIDLEIGAPNPNALTENLRTFEGEPRNNTALVQLMISTGRSWNSTPPASASDVSCNLSTPQVAPTRSKRSVEFK